MKINPLYIRAHNDDKHLYTQVRERIGARANTYKFMRDSYDNENITQIVLFLLYFLLFFESCLVDFSLSSVYTASVPAGFTYVKS